MPDRRRFQQRHAHAHIQTFKHLAPARCTTDAIALPLGWRFDQSLTGYFMVGMHKGERRWRVSVDGLHRLTI